jgi:NRPS condensation-like uncharacterized protein
MAQTDIIVPRIEKNTINKVIHMRNDSHSRNQVITWIYLSSKHRYNIWKYSDEHDATNNSYQVVNNNLSKTTP